MILVSNRGNTVGPSERANHPDYIKCALDQGFLVKTDLWVFPRIYASGIDKPVYNVDMDSLKRCLVEARNLNAFEFIIKSGLHGFYRDKSELLFTNKGYLLSYGPWFKEAIIMNPEDHTFDNLLKSYGICSDFIKGFVDENSSIS